MNLDHRVQWVYPHPPNETRMECCTVRQAVVRQRAHAQKVRRGFQYRSNREALEDFMAVHWAWYTNDTWDCAVFRGNGPFQRLITIYEGASSAGYGGRARYTTMHPAMHHRGENF